MGELLHKLFLALVRRRNESTIHLQVLFVSQTKTYTVGWRAQRRGRGISFWDLVRKDCRWSTEDKFQFSHFYVVNLFLPTTSCLFSFQQPPPRYGFPNEPNHLSCGSNNMFVPYMEAFPATGCAKQLCFMKLHSAHPPLFFYCFCSAETQTRPLQGWKLAVYSSSQFPIPQQVFSMTEPYVLHSMPLSIHFWPTVKIFALTTQIQNTQWFFNPFGINSLLQ